MDYRYLPWGPDVQQPMLLVVIDTEEEFDWDAPFDSASTSVRNISEQPRAQDVLDAYGVCPTYVVTYPVATSLEARTVLGGLAEAGRCMIGAHLHPWVTPPHDEAVNNRHSFAGNLPPTLEHAKLVTLTTAIEAGFGAAPTIYKAGRYGIGPETMRFLKSLGYGVDCSVVPYTDFTDIEGPDFTNYTDRPFLASSGILELPMSVNFVGALSRFGSRLFPFTRSALGASLRLPGLAARSGMLERLRLTPEGHTAQDMIRQTKAALSQGTKLFMVTYHSSSLLPGATPYVRDAVGRDAFLGTLRQYLAFFVNSLGGKPTTIKDVASMLHR